METRIIASRIQNTEEKREGIAMKEEIDWKKEILESGKFNNNFQKIY